MNRSRVTRRVGAAIVAFTLLGPALAGCVSQIDALAPVSGDDVSAVRTATTDVLLAGEADILEAPNCTKSETAITCVGALVDGSAISVDAPLGTPDTMTITVAGETIYSGSIQDVLTSNAGGAE